MVTKRNTLEQEPETVTEERPAKGLYFAAPSPDVEFITSGCAVLDCVLGGGWPLGRMSNVIGDASTGKSLIAIEACANFAHQYPDGKIFYNEAEAAFDKGYAAALGMPIDRVEFVEGCHTVEALFNDIKSKLKELGNKNHAIYVIDSLDALSDDAEKKRDIDDGSYGMNKQKKMGELFRRLVKDIERSKMNLMIISQVRENIGVSFGEKYRRSGGKAMDFYASQCLWLAHKGKVKKTKNKVERVVGVDIKANCKKNKIGLPFRTCEFQIEFGFGIDDVTANLNWLAEVNKLDLLDMKDKKEIKPYVASMAKFSQEEYLEQRKMIAETVQREWQQIEEGFLPTRRKY